MIQEGPLSFSEPITGATLTLDDSPMWTDSISVTPPLASEPIVPVTGIRPAGDDETVPSRSGIRRGALGSHHADSVVATLGQDRSQDARAAKGAGRGRQFKTTAIPPGKAEHSSTPSILAALADRMAAQKDTGPSSGAFEAIDRPLDTAAWTITPAPDAELSPADRHGRASCRCA